MVGADGIVVCAEPSDDVRVSLKIIKGCKRPIKESWYQSSPNFVYHKRVPLNPWGKPELAPFCWDLRFPGNPVTAAVHRFSRKMPTPCPDKMRELVLFAKSFVEMLKPVDREKVPTFEEWLSKTHYGPSRKLVLTNLRKSLNVLDKNFFKCKSFVKLEVYESMTKLARAINSYSDDSKALLGPLFHAVDKAFFAHRFFVKGTNPKDWPERLKLMFGDLPVASTDFTSFEAHHQGALAELVHMWFEHMTKELDLDETTRKIVRVFMLGRNTLDFKEVTIECDQRLMSGALWTSSANSFLNLLINTFLITRGRPGSEAQRAHWAFHNVQGVVEGDDGLFVDYGQSDEVAASIGCVLKMERFQNFAGAGFCGIVCDPDNLVVLKNPKAVLRKFFLLPGRYAKSKESVKDGLLRAKALSYYHAYRTCPIVGELCYQTILATSKVQAITGAVDAWHLTALNDAIKERIWDSKPEISMNSRIIVEEQFGVSVDDQLRIEADIRANPTGFLTGWGSSDDYVYCDRYVSADDVKPDRTISKQLCELLERVGATTVRGRHKSAPARLTSAMLKTLPHAPEHVRLDW